MVRLEGGRASSSGSSSRTVRRRTRRALFFASGQRQASELPARLGCRFTENGAVDTGKCEATNVPGLYVCGDASREAQFVVVAAAEGAEAGMAINKALLEEELPAPTRTATRPPGAPAGRAVGEERLSEVRAAAR